jgi:predicted ATPase
MPTCLHLMPARLTVWWRTGGELASVFPALRSLRGDSPPPGNAAERFRAHYAVRELIERLAARRPLVLALDDIQWSDCASAELIGHLLTRPPDAAVMLVATLRPGHAPAMLAATIQTAVRAGTAMRLELGPLDRQDAARLVGASVPPLDLEDPCRDSGGNPFYLLQLARDAARKPIPSGPQWSDIHDVPAAVSASIASELDALSGPARTFARAAAAAGDPFDLDLAIRAAGMGESDALAALDELIAREILRPGDTPRRFRFRHPLVRKGIYATAPPVTRLVCHQRAATALEAQGAPAVTVPITSRIRRGRAILAPARS